MIDWLMDWLLFIVESAEIHLHWLKEQECTKSWRYQRVIRDGEIFVIVNTKFVVNNGTEMALWTLQLIVIKKGWIVNRSGNYRLMEVYTHIYIYIVYQQTSNDNSNNLLQDFAYVHGTLHYTKERPSFPFLTIRQRIN